MAKLSTIKPRIQTVDLRRGAGVGTERIRGGRLTKIRERILLCTTTTITPAAARHTQNAAPMPSI